MVSTRFSASNYDRCLRTHLSVSLDQRWIGRSGPVPGPHALPDLSRVDFFLWVTLKAVLYATPVESEMDKVAKVVCAAAAIRENPRVIVRIHRSKVRRCNVCFACNGVNFEHLL